MKILKIINNNVVSAYDESKHEVVIMGKGVGFGMRPGQYISNEKIEKIFRMDSQKSSERFEELLADIPLEHISISSDIIDYTTEHLNKKLNKNIYITLTDHINFAIERYKEKMNFSNPLLYDVKMFYKQEFAIGIYSIELIHKRLGIKLPIDEAASVALHIVNAEYNAQIGDIMDTTKLIRSIINIVEDYFGISLDEHSLDFERFLTHLKFFILRAYKKEKLPNSTQELKKLIQQEYSSEYVCSKKIASYIEAAYHQTIQNDELIYLAVHIKRVTYNRQG